MSQCQTYTAAPARGTQPFETDSTVSSMVSGTPVATPDDEPKLERMSRRTMPLWVSALGPLEPSPGYGPAVSWGMGEHDPDDVAVVEVLAPAEAVAAAVDVVAPRVL